MKKIRFGVIGCGSIANEYHLPALRRVEGAQLVWACDLIEERAQKAKDDFGFEKYTLDYHDILNDSSIDAVCIFTKIIDRALETYLKKGYSREWINQRLQAIQVRKELTDEWQDRGVQKGVEFAILTDEITRAWSGMTTRQYKKLKGLKKENLRDNMTTLEIVLNMLAEATTTELSKVHQPQGFAESREIAKRGGSYAGETRKSIEADTGRSIITSENAAQLNAVVTGVIEGVINAEDENEK